MSSFSMRSHLLTAIIIPLPRSCAIPAILASCSVTPSSASITRTATSQRSTAETVRMILNLSISSLILLLRRSPAVSMKTYSLPFLFTVVSMASLVVPAISETISLSSPRSLLIIEEVDNGLHPSKAKELMKVSKEISADNVRRLRG